MLKKINLILLLSGFVIFLLGCKTSSIPAGYRYNPRALKREITGSWTEVKLNRKEITTVETMLSGELIAIQSDTVFILTSAGLESVHTSNISQAVLYMYMNQSGKYAAATGLLYIPNIVAAIAYGEPGFLALGVPWLLTGTIMTIVEGSNHSNILNYPYPSQLQDLNKFARFPQGMPPGIDKARLHLITTK
jgi:hypothetical protein